MNEKFLVILSWICEINPTPCKKYIQKLMYLIERKGIDLGLEYRIHYYGPYCADLNNILFELRMDDLIEVDTDGYEHTVTVKKSTDDNALKALVGTLSYEEQIIIRQTLDQYAKKTPKELEILTTTDFVAEGLKDEGNLNQETLVKFVTDIKGKKFSNTEILNSIKALESDNLIKIN